MALAPGTRLGAYEIISPLGAGGMGEVYRATDTRLKRSVAIKVLLPEVAQNSERLARFEREAQILASLNHPSIAAIYGVEQAGATTALILEFIDGPTLADRIARGPIPINEALPIANQVAEALEAAHEQGVIHRDLKPANIKVRPDGTVKVLDFGLAKALEPVSVGSTPLTNAPTITSPAMVTGAGMILGTAAYIAPEQARGKAVDRRADIWAFGCVLFEMLTGTRAFAGEDVADVLSRVLQREPELAALPAGTSPPVRTLIAHCLVKDPRHRLRDIGDARLALDGAFETPTPQATRSTALPASRERRALIAALSLAVLLILAMVGPTIRYLREPPPSSQPETRLDIVTPPASSTTGFALSPDGRKIAYVGTDEGIPRLWVRSLDSVVPQALPGTDNARNPFWSPDGRSLGFFAERKLKRIDLGGGQPQTLTEVTSETAQGAWNAEGTILFAQPVAGGPLFRISVSGGQPLAATTLRPGESGHWSPRFIAGGRQYIYASQGSIPALWLGSLDDSSAGQDHAAEPRRITAWNPDTESSGEYLAPNWLVQVRGRFLVAQRFDIGSGLLSGDAVTLAQVSTIDPATLTAAFSVSTSGAIAWRGGTGNSNQLIWFNRSGE
ncbi:MAG TPA: protein kinase, partial [Vicinamibacterales bacterium]|nr:protein kinase [Vicinamibacterales bacterium]